MKMEYSVAVPHAAARSDKDDSSGRIEIPLDLKTFLAVQTTSVTIEGIRRK
jgi:hypothetical protein